MALQFGGGGAAGAAEEPALVGGSFGAADAFPKDFGYGEEEEEAELDGGPGSGGPGGGGGAGGPGGGAGGADSKPRILLMGLRRSGKSSIQKVSAGYPPLLRVGAGEGRLRRTGGGRPGVERTPPGCARPPRWSPPPRAAGPGSVAFPRRCRCSAGAAPAPPPVPVGAEAALPPLQAAARCWARRKWCWEPPVVGGKIPRSWGRRGRVCSSGVLFAGAVWGRGCGGGTGVVSPEQGARRFPCNANLAPFGAFCKTSVQRSLFCMLHARRNGSAAGSSTAQAAW